jgi:hypothetical protein
MSATNNEKQLKHCLEDTMNVIHVTLTRLKRSTMPESNDTSINSVVTNMNTFTLNTQEDEEMDKLKSDIERILTKHTPALSGECLNYILNFLYQYDYDGDKHQLKMV